ncbi:MAG: CoA transferase [Xanthomonadales bacterium]|nr:CoA transferase [Xanthomonadales bacterium]
MSAQRPAAGDPRPPSPALPLDGLRVLTFEAFGAGPFGSMYLADLGAEVIKIENRAQGGDATRGMGPFFLGEHDSHFFQTFNLNKRSVCLDLKQPAGREALHVTGEPGSPPSRMGLSIIDYMTGITTALALVSALLGVARGGSGRDIDVSLFDVALHQLSYPGTWYLNDQLVTGRAPRSAHPTATPVQLFKTADGWIFVMCMTEKFWQELLRVIDAPAVAADPRFSDMAARREHRDALTAALDGVFETDTTAHWLEKLQGVLPAAPVYDLAQALDNPFPIANGMIRTTPHPLRADFRSFANPIKLDGKRLPAASGPALGADTEAVLGDLGYTAEELAALRASGIT